MEQIIPFKGKVAFPVTLDPGVWIFDDRRIDLDTYFAELSQTDTDPDEEYTKSMSKFWEKEIREGAIFPPTIQSEKKYEKEKVLTGSFGVPLTPFLKNAEPEEDASHLVIETEKGEHSFPIEEADSLIMAFSNKGKPLREDGPVHILLKDGSNLDSPITHVTAIRLD
ncbi:hypothetical protein BTO30_16415 [Domibacillus antri]|uniref:Peptidyl-prolyl cis-trans isomerase n=1 Tax=Domibacillus antri TaxID=1714264 RepID=A0A1Q8Q1H3_9BACI|nr:hypothetical protein [Domibacillus antri]OLN21161.1 hypothetical protein BTO30_16415 [Domibacillus antri]